MQGKRIHNEIRFSEGKPDDIAVFDMHLENMADNFWWLGYYHNGKRTTFHIESKTPITVTVIENELKTKMVDET